MMKIVKILNNNVALVTKGDHESIVYSTGISFQKKAGQHIYDSEIEKTYVLDSKDRLEHFSYLLTQSDEATIQLVNDLVQYGSEMLNVKLTDYLYLALLDHITFARKRGEKSQFIRSPLAWEVKKFYPQYYEISRYGLEKMTKIYHISFPDDEAIPIALHFVNCQENSAGLEEKIEDMATLRDMLNIVQYHFNSTLDETSINYMRLVTHLQYFIARLHKQKIPNQQETLFYQVKKLYPEAYKAVEKIAIYVLGKFDQKLPKEEFTYLMIHINRVTERGDE